jgi:hypothetical protein
MQRAQPKRFVCAVLLLFAASSPALTQEPTLKNAIPPELQPLIRMIGVWEVTAKCRYSPDAPVFKGRSIESVYWAESHQFIISDKRGSTPGGWGSQLQVTTWDPIHKNFQLIELTPGRGSTNMVMTVDGDVAKIIGTRTDSGHTTQFWLTSKYVSPTESHFRSECSVDDGPKWLFSEGIAKKVK